MLIVDLLICAFNLIPSRPRQLLFSFLSPKRQGSTYTTTRISNVGSRFDKIGGESAILASSLGGEVGREHITIGNLTIDGLAAVAAGGELAGLDKLKSQLSTKVSNASYENQMLDQLHSTAYQTSPSGNSLGNALEGSVESIESITVEDVSAIARGVNGSNVVVVGTGSGIHDQLVDVINKKLGGLKSSASGGNAVAEAGEASAFLGSDVRYVHV